MAVSIKRAVPDIYDAARNRLSKSNTLYSDESWKRIASGNAGEATLDSYIYALDKMPTDEKELKKFQAEYLYDYAKETDKIWSIYNEVYANRDNTDVIRQFYKQDENGKFYKKGGKLEGGGYEEILTNELPQTKENGKLDSNFIINEVPMSDYEYYKQALKKKNSAAYEEYLLNLKRQQKASQDAGTKFGNFLGSLFGEFAVNGVINQIKNLTASVSGILDGAIEFFKSGDLEPEEAWERASKARVESTMRNANLEDDPLNKLYKKFNEWEIENSSFRDVDGSYTSLGKWVGTTANTIGKMVPSMIATFFMKGATKGLTGTASKVADKGIQIASSGLFYAGFSTEQIIETYNFLAENNISISNAKLLANVDAKMFLQYLVEFGLDKILGASALDAMAFGRATKSVTGKNFSSRAFVRTLKYAWQEGTEEVLQDLTDYIVDRIYAVSVNENFAKLSEFNGQTVFDAFIMGALTSLIGSNARALIHKPMKSTNIKSTNIEYDSDGKPITDEKDIVIKAKNINQYASWEYGLTLQEFFSSAKQILDENDKLRKRVFTLSKKERDKLNLDKEDTKYRRKVEKSMMAMYELYRVLTDFYNEIGDDRAIAANELLTMIQDAPTMSNVAQVIDDNINNMIETLDTIGLYQKSELYRNAVLLEKLEENENLKTLHAYQRGDKIEVKDAEKLAEDINKLLGDEDKEVEQKVKKIFDKNPDVKNIVVTEKGAMTYDEESKTMFAGKNLILMTDNDKILYNGIAEQVIIDNFAKEVSQHNFKSFTMDKLLDVYKKYHGVKGTAERAVAAILFNSDFAYNVLMEGNIDTYQFVSSFKEFVSKLFDKKYETIKPKINEALQNLKEALKQYCIIQVNARTDISLFTPSDVDYIVRNRTHKQIFNRVVEGKTTEADLNVIHKQIRLIEAPYEYKVKLFENIQSKDAKLRYDAMLRLGTKLETSFYNEYDGKTYMPVLSIPNRVFNNYLQSNGLTIQTLDRPANDSEASMIGEITKPSCIAYHKRMFEKSTNNYYTFEYDENNNIYIVEKQTNKAVGFGDVKTTWDAYLQSQHTGEGNIVENISFIKSWKNKVFNKNVDNTIKEFSTIDDVITHSEYLSDNILANIKKDYGIVNTDRIAVYLRDMIIKDSNSDYTIVMMKDGRYAIASVKDMKSVFKKPITLDMLNKDIPLWTVLNDKYAKYISGTDAKIVITRNKDIKAEYRGLKIVDDKYLYDNNIYINPKYFKSNTVLNVILTHEFQHVIQNVNAINGGIVENILDKKYVNDTTKNTIIKDVMKHKPELFEGLDYKNNDDYKKITEIVSDYIYLASGEYQAAGLSSDTVIDFSPVLIQRNVNGMVSIVFPWGSSYIVYSDKGEVVASQISNCMKLYWDNDDEFKQFKESFTENVDSKNIKMTGKINENIRYDGVINTYADIQKAVDYFGATEKIKADTVIPIVYVGPSIGIEGPRIQYNERVFVGFPEGKAFDTFVAKLYDKYPELYGDRKVLIGLDALSVNEYMEELEFPLTPIHNVEVIRNEEGNFVPLNEFKYPQYVITDKFAQLQGEIINRDLTYLKQAIGDKELLSEQEGPIHNLGKYKYEALFESKKQLGEQIVGNLNNVSIKEIYDARYKEHQDFVNNEINKLDTYLNTLNKVTDKVEYSKLKYIREIIYKISTGYNFDVFDIVKKLNEIANIINDTDIKTNYDISSLAVFKNIIVDGENISIIKDLYLSPRQLILRDMMKSFGTMMEYGIYDRMPVRGLFIEQSRDNVLTDWYLPQNIFITPNYGYETIGGITYDNTSVGKIINEYGEIIDVKREPKLNPKSTILEKYTTFNTCMHEFGHALKNLLRDTSFKDNLPSYLKSFKELQDIVLLYKNRYMKLNVNGDTYERILFNGETCDILATIYQQIKEVYLIHSNEQVDEEVLVNIFANIFEYDFDKLTKLQDDVSLQFLADIAPIIADIWNDLGIITDLNDTKLVKIQFNQDKLLETIINPDTETSQYVDPLVDLFTSSYTKKYDDSILPEHKEDAKQYNKEFKDKGISIKQIVEEHGPIGTKYVSKLIGYTDNGERITLRRYYPPRLGDYISKQDAKITNLKYFNITQMPKDLQSFIVNANLKLLDEELVNKIKNGTLTKQDIDNWIRNTPTSEMDEYTFKLVNDYIYKTSIKSPKQLEFYVDRTANFYGLKAALKTFERTGKLKEETVIKLNNIKSQEELKKVVDILKKDDALRTIYEGVTKQFKEEYLDLGLFNNMREISPQYGSTVDRFVNDGISRKYLQILWMRNFDGTLKSGTDIASIAKSTVYNTRYYITGEAIDKTKSLNELNEKGDEVMNNIADDTTDVDDDAIFANYVDTKDDEELLEDVLESLTLKYVYQVYKAYGKNVNVTKFKEDLTKKREETIEGLGKLFNMNEKEVRKQQLQLYNFMYEMGLEQLTPEQLKQLNKPGNEYLKRKYFKDIVKAGEESLQAFYIRYLSQLFLGSDYRLQDNGAIILSKRTQRIKLLGINNILKTIMKHIAPKNYGLIIEKNSDILELSKNGQIVLKKNVYLKDNEIKLDEKELNAIHDRVKALSEAIRKAKDEKIKLITVVQTGKDVFNKSMKELEKQLKSSDTTVDRLSKENTKLQKEVQKQKQIIYAYERGSLEAKSTKDMPKKLNELLMYSFNKSRKSMTQLTDNADRHYIQTTLTQFYKDNDLLLSSLNQQEIDDIINYLITTEINGDITTMTTYDAVKMAVLTYIISKHERNAPNISLTPEQVKQINDALYNKVNVASQTLSNWKASLKYLREHSLQIIASSAAKKNGIQYDGMEDDIKDIENAVYSQDIKAIKAARDKMYNNALKYVKGKKQDIFDRLLRFERSAMLSGPGTWVRNQVSNIKLTFYNKLGEQISKIFPDRDVVIDRLNRKVDETGKSEPYKQYKIVGTVIRDDIKTFINDVIIKSGLFDMIDDGFTKYDPRLTEPGSKTQEMVVQAIVDKLSSEANIKGTVNEKSVMGKYYSFVYKMLSDKSWIKKAFLVYLGKMLTEDDFNVKDAFNKYPYKDDYLGRPIYSKQLMDTVANAFILATQDYMHKGNFVMTIERWIHKKGGSKGYFLWKQLFPFLGASLNWAVAGLKMSPIGLAHAIIKYARMEKSLETAYDKYQRKDTQISPRLTQYLIKRDLGKGIIGTVGWIIGLILGGVGAARIDDEDDKFKLVIGSTFIDISGIFGTQGIMMGIVSAGMIRAGMKGGKSFEEILRTVFNSTIDQIFIDTSLTDFFNNFRYNSGIGDWIASIPISILSMFIPNFIKQLSAFNKYTVNYEPGIIGKFERLSVQALPFLSYVYPHKVDPYTGEDQVMYRLWWLTQIFNKYQPLKIYPYNVSEAEKEAIALGINKGQMTGNFTINDEDATLNKADTEKLNTYYGELNKKSLNEFINNKTEYQVKDENGKLVTLKYRNMNDTQKANVMNRIMNDNAQKAKIYILTSTGKYKYYTSDAEYEELKSMGIKKNVYKKTDKKDGYVKI